MFKKTSNVFLALSIAWSVKSIYFVTLKTISIMKPFLPTSTKLVLMLWIIVSSSARVMAIVFYFIPGFGLFSILGHWRMEQTPYSYTVNVRFKDDKTVYLYDSEPVAWTDLNRWTYTTDRYNNSVPLNAPEYTMYTYFTLQEYSIGFGILLFIQICITALAKIFCSEDFRKSGSSSLLFKFVHCIENSNIPTVWMDWEEQKGSIEDHKRRHGQVLKEMVVIMIIRSIFNAIMLTPIVYTGDRSIYLYHTFKKYLFLQPPKFGNATTF